MQIIFQIFSAYFSDGCADELTMDPVFTAILYKPFLVSQLTLSRFHNRVDGDTLTQLDEIGRALLRTIYSNWRPPITQSGTWM